MSKTACAVCASSDGKLCGGCNSIAYCSVICQKKDWKFHRALCAAFKDLSDDKRPHSETTRAIYLPYDSTKPKLIWLTYTPEENEDFKDNRLDKVDSAPFLLDSFGKVNPEIGMYNRDIRGHSLRHTIIRCNRNEYMYDGSRPNQVVLNLLGDDKADMWRGSLLFYGLTGDIIDPNRCDDLDLSLIHI